KLYDLARKGVVVDVPRRKVTIHAIEVVAWAPPDATILVECSAGTYIRSLARDLGESVHTGAMLANLIRTRSGKFSLSTSIPVDSLDERLEAHGWPWIAVHPDDVLDRAGMVELQADDEPRWFNGIEIPAGGHAGVVRVYDTRREWVGIGRGNEQLGTVKPSRVVRGNGEQA
ncbi:MAG TPA: tRNA pseudouridine(55) synthase TruB, partial [Thermomicrobiales bacterium]|nr:tRNA pseudouridine(55) synthase TruB [Thermomicrobiales bacterium]